RVGADALELDGRLGGRELPLHEVVADLLEGDARHLRVAALDLRPRALHELLGAARRDVDETELRLDVRRELHRMVSPIKNCEASGREASEDRLEPLALTVPPGPACHDHRAELVDRDRKVLVDYRIV